MGLGQGILHVLGHGPKRGAPEAVAPSISPELFDEYCIQKEADVTALLRQSSSSLNPVNQQKLFEAVYEALSNICSAQPIPGITVSESDASLAGNLGSNAKEFLVDGYNKDHLTTRPVFTTKTGTESVDIPLLIAESSNLEALMKICGYLESIRPEDGSSKLLFIPDRRRY